MALIVMEVLTRSRGMSVEERLHVLDRVDGNAHPPDLALGQGIVGVVADLGGQVEGDAQAGLALLEQVAVPAVRLLGIRVSRVLAHGPEPAAVHGGLRASGEGVLAGIAGALP